MTLARRNTGNEPSRYSSGGEEELAMLDENAEQKKSHCNAEITRLGDTGISQAHLDYQAATHSLSSELWPAAFA